MAHTVCRQKTSAQPSVAVTWIAAIHVSISVAHVQHTPPKFKPQVSCMLLDRSRVCNGSSVKFDAACIAQNLQDANSTLSQQFVHKIGCCPPSRCSFIASTAFAGSSRLHLPCRQRCTRTLLCGHECGKGCHRGSTCPPCSGQCAAQCVHGRCMGACTELCAPCAEPCTWQCPHQVNSSCTLFCWQCIN